MAIAPKGIDLEYYGVGGNRVTRWVLGVMAWVFGIKLHVVEAGKKEGIA
ncbi:hypothetical protein M0Q28_06440 [Patescibacteria group bacterium]|jgi:hypothetical protein|nr:hypothetical protein [Patescibacteria group bacterium]